MVVVLSLILLNGIYIFCSRKVCKIVSIVNDFHRGVLKKGIIVLFNSDNRCCLSFFVDF